jgi:hypothetical protein
MLLLVHHTILAYEQTSTKISLEPQPCRYRGVVRDHPVVLHLVLYVREADVFNAVVFSKYLKLACR